MCASCRLDTLEQCLSAVSVNGGESEDYCASLRREPTTQDNDIATREAGSHRQRDGDALVDTVECSESRGIQSYLPAKDDAEESSGVVSSLEKYFTEELLIPQRNFDCFDDYDSDQEPSVPPVPPAQGYLIEEEILSDVSTSSDDLFAAQPGQQAVAAPAT
ncbi:hypothetical protein BIW11_03960, partial [Tropilaelaps mercedesae]